ncbi:hypothetical protein OF83DRAFT_1174535 [Amylostereum chailletii]|nr:hypothetical protein OF83DRAFT_1174535 [Amylostereum chailletii]
MSNIPGPSSRPTPANDRPDTLVFVYRDHNKTHEVGVGRAKTYQEAIDFAMEAFPMLRNKERTHFTFSAYLPVDDGKSAPDAATTDPALDGWKGTMAVTSVECRKHPSFGYGRTPPSDCCIRYSTRYQIDTEAHISLRANPSVDKKPQSAIPYKLIRIAPSAWTAVLPILNRSQEVQVEIQDPDAPPEYIGTKVVTEEVKADAPTGSSQTSSMRRAWSSLKGKGAE